jgi:hypothetical protein
LVQITTHVHSGTVSLLPNFIPGIEHC